MTAAFSPVASPPATLEMAMKANAHSQNMEEKTLEVIAELLVAAQKAIAPYVTPLTPKDRRTLPKMGEKTLAFVEKCHEFAQQNPDLWPKYLDMDEFTADYKDARGLFSIVNLSAQLQQSFADTQMCSGSEALQTSLVFYNTAKVAANNGVLGAKAVYEELRKRFPNRTHRKAASDDTVPQDDSQEI